MRTALIAAVVAVLVATSTTAAARPVSLRYQAPEACPPESVFRAGVDGRTAQAAWQDEDGEEVTSLEVEVSIEDDGARGRLVVREPGRAPAAPREVRDATCDTVVDALALVAALAIDPKASLAPTLRPVPPPPVRKPAPPPKPPPSPEPAEPPSMVPSVPPSWRWSLGVGVGLTSGVGARGYLQLVPLYLDLRRSEAVWTPSARLAFAVLLPSDVDSPAGSARITRLAGQLSACPVGLDLPGFRLAPCAGIELGVFRAEGLDVERPRVASDLWAAALLGLRTSTQIGERFFVGAEASASLPLTRPRVVVAPGQLIAETAPAAAVVSGGLGVELP